MQLFALGEQSIIVNKEHCNGTAIAVSRDMKQPTTQPVPPVVSRRLQKCFDAGGTLALFPLLKDWNKAELQSLLADVEAYDAAMTAVIEYAHREIAFQPANFLSRSRSKAADRAAEAAHFENLAMCAEICSVVYHYLGEVHNSASCADLNCELCFGPIASEDHATPELQADTDGILQRIREAKK